MSVVDDPKTLGRARLSFASEADIDEFVDDARALRARRADARPVARVPSGARHLRPAPGRRRADAARQDSAGRADGRPARGARRRRRAVLARLRPHHDAAEHPVPFRQAARRRAGDAPARRRRADDARSVRQLGAQHHRVPVRRRRRRRAVRRHAVRRGADALSAAPSAQLDAAAQVQDRVRRLRDRSRRDRRSTISGSAPCSAPTAAAGFRVTAGGGTAIMVTSAGLLHEFLPASEILRVAEAVLRVFHRLGDYQHKQRNRMKFMIKTLGWTRWREEYDRELTACRLRGAGADARHRSAGERIEARLGEGLVAVGRPHRRRAWRPAASSGPGLTPTVVPVFHAGDEAYARWRATNVRPQKQFGLRDGDGHRAARRSDERADARGRRAGARLRRRHRPRDAGPGSACSAG